MGGNRPPHDHALSFKMSDQGYRLDGDNEIKCPADRCTIGSSKKSRVRCLTSFLQGNMLPPEGVKGVRSNPDDEKEVSKSPEKVQGLNLGNTLKTTLAGFVEWRDPY